MSFRYFQVMSIATVACLLVGCSSEIQVKPKLTTYSREDLSKGEIKLPGNYNKNNYRKLLLGVAVSEVTVKVGEIPPEISETLSARLQTEMAKLKRFSVFSAHNRGGVQFFKSLADVGEAKLPEAVNVRELDLVLSVAVTISKETQARYNDDMIIYEVECDFNGEDMKTQEAKFAEKAKGRTRRVMKFSLTGKKLAGYDDNDERQAIYNAAMKALAVGANKLGNRYPVGGHITGMVGKRMTLDKGFEHGIGHNMQMVVYTSKNGVDIPLGIAEAYPADTTSNLVMWRWNDSDDEAEKIHDDIKNDPDWLKNNELYAVSYGMAVPPEFENAYKSALDEEMRAK